MLGKRKSDKHKPMNPQERENLEESVTTIKEFLSMWTEFYWMVRRSFLDKQFKPAQERDFLKLKSEVARRHEYLVEQLGRNYVGGKGITDILRMTVNLEKLAATATENYYKLEKFWHEVYLNLSDSLFNIQFKLEQEEKNEVK